MPRGQINVLPLQARRVSTVKAKNTSLAQEVKSIFGDSKHVRLQCERKRHKPG